MSPTIRHKYKYFHSTVQRAKDKRQKFHFCSLPFDVRPRNVKLNLSMIKLAKRFSGSIRPVTSALVSIFKATKLAQFSSQTKKKVSKCPIWERSKNEFLTVLHYLLNRYEKIFQTISEISCCFG